MKSRLLYAMFSFIGSLLLLWALRLTVYSHYSILPPRVRLIMGIVFVSALAIFALLWLFWTNWLKTFLQEPGNGQPFSQQGDRHIVLALILLCAGFLFIFLLNNIFPLIDTQTGQLKPPQAILVAKQIGIDFRLGFYRPAIALLSNPALYAPIAGGKTVLTMYPPLVNILALPYTLFSENSAYKIHMVVLFFANIACMVFAAILAKEYLFRENGIKSLAIVVIITGSIAFYTFTGYPFLFSMERGNYDILTMLFSLLAVWVLLRAPQRIWLTVFLLSIAVHLKIYPAALFVLVFYRHKAKAILPTVVINAIFLLSLGPQNLIWFIQAVFYYASIASVWVGNHSGYTYATGLSRQFPNLSGYLTALRIGFTLLPAALWTAGMVILLRRKLSDENIILGLLLTVPVMDTVPNISHDYKLVIMSPALILLIALIIRRIGEKHQIQYYLPLLLVLASCLFYGQSYAYIKDPPWLIGNKYPWSLLLEGIVMWIIINGSLPDKKVADSYKLEAPTTQRGADHERQPLTL